MRESKICTTLHIVNLYTLIRVVRAAWAAVQLGQPSTETIISPAVYRYRFGVREGSEPRLSDAVPKYGVFLPPTEPMATRLREPLYLPPVFLKELVNPKQPIKQCKHRYTLMKLNTE